MSLGIRWRICQTLMFAATSTWKEVQRHTPESWEVQRGDESATARIVVRAPGSSWPLVLITLPTLTVRVDPFVTFEGRHVCDVRIAAHDHQIIHLGENNYERYLPTAEDAEDVQRMLAEMTHTWKSKGLQADLRKVINPNG